MKKVKIYWDKEIFDGVHRLLPNTNQLYSQITVEDKTWSLIFYFSSAPILQGYITEGEVKFLAEDAPHEALHSDFEFNFLDGKLVVGKCVIFAGSIGSIDSILQKIELIDNHKKRLINELKHLNNNQISYDDQQLTMLVKHSDEYLAIFPLIIHLNSEIAEEYLKEKMFEFIRMYNNSPLIHPYIPYFLYHLIKVDSTFPDSLPEEIKTDHFFSRMLKDV